MIFAMFWNDCRAHLGQSCTKSLISFAPIVWEMVILGITLWNTHMVFVSIYVIYIWKSFSHSWHTTQRQYALRYCDVKFLVKQMLLLINILKGTLQKKYLMNSYITLNLQIKLLMPKAFYWESSEEKAAGVDYKEMTYVDVIARGNVHSRKKHPDFR